ncbi:unnamed protein product, partial [Rotaria magnacalcarata]
GNMNKDGMNNLSVIDNNSQRYFMGHTTSGQTYHSPTLNDFSSDNKYHSCHQHHHQHHHEPESHKES